jgi:hypothetical protein
MRQQHEPAAQVALLSASKPPMSYETMEAVHRHACGVMHGACVDPTWRAGRSCRARGRAAAPAASRTARAPPGQRRPARSLPPPRTAARTPRARSTAPRRAPAPQVQTAQRFRHMLKCSRLCSMCLERAPCPRAQPQRNTELLEAELAGEQHNLQDPSSWLSQPCRNCGRAACIMPS